MNTRDWINEEEMKKRLDVSSSTLCRWRKAGLVVFAKFGDKMMYDWSSVTEKLNAQVNITKNKAA